MRDPACVEHGSFKLEHAMCMFPFLLVSILRRQSRLKDQANAMNSPLGLAASLGEAIYFPPALERLHTLRLSSLGEATK